MIAASKNPAPDNYSIRQECLALINTRLTEFVRLAGIHQENVLKKFSDTIKEVHEQLANSTERDGFADTDGLTASRISLVGLNELETEIRIADLITRLQDAPLIDFYKIQLRYMRLLKRMYLTQETTPCGITLLMEGCWAVVDELGPSQEKQFDFLDRFEEVLLVHLPELFESLHTFFDNNGVTPASTPSIPRESHQTFPLGPQPSSDTQAPHRPQATLALSALHAALQQNGPLPNLFGSTGEPAHEGSISPEALAMLDNLTKQLTQFKPALKNTPASSGKSSTQRRPKAPTADTVGIPAGSPLSQAFDTLSMIFETIASAEELPDFVKESMSSLQIPMLRQAMLSPSFFTAPHHPAKAVLNQLAQASFGLNEHNEASAPYRGELQKISEHFNDVLNNSKGSPEDFADTQEQLSKLITARKELTEAQASAYITVAERYETREAAKHQAQRWLQGLYPRIKHREIAHFAMNTWVQVMQLAWLNGGTQGKLWQECSNAIDSLLWTLEPKPTPGERKQLTARIPTLIQQLQKGMAWLKLPEENRQQFLDTCFVLQTANLRGETREINPPPPLPPIPAPDTPTNSKALEHNGKVIHYFGSPYAEKTTSSPLPLGQWFKFKRPDQKEPVCGQLCWQSHRTDGVLFYNTDWKEAVVVPCTLIEQQLADQSTQNLSAQTFFDTVAERALVQLSRTTNDERAGG